MSGISGTESLVVCLSEYLPLCTSNDSHDSSVGVCFLKRSCIASATHHYEASFSPIGRGKWGNFGNVGLIWKK